MHGIIQTAYRARYSYNVVIIIVLSRGHQCDNTTVSTIRKEPTFMHFLLRLNRGRGVHCGTHTLRCRSSNRKCLCKQLAPLLSVEGRVTGLI